MEVTALKGSSGDVQHFADRIIAGHGVRYGHVAMVPISVKMKRRPKVYLTIETPVVACRFRVCRHVSNVPRSGSAAIATNFPHGLGR